MALNLTNFMPFWNSLDSVRRIHSDLELAALISFALLVFFDVLAHIASDEKRQRIFGEIGLWFFGFAVLFEFIAYPYGQRNDTLSEQIIGSLDIKSKQAERNASKALRASGKALIQANDALATTDAAKSAMDTAKSEAAKARANSSESLTLATGARKEADSFESDIIAAKAQAAAAESHLADALDRANAAQKESIRLREILAGWQLDDKSKEKFANDVRGFPGTSYGLAVNPVESAFMEQLDGILTSTSVGWIRQPPPSQSGFVLAIDGKASIVITSGILIEVDQDQEALKPAIVALGTAFKDTLGLSTVNIHLVPPGSWGKNIHIIIGRRQ